MKKLSIIVLLITLFFSLSAQNKVQRVIAFYNCENLFDTINDPNEYLSDEFTPQSPKKWNTEKYYKKLDNLARVFGEIAVEADPMGPAIIGCAEIENQGVLVDLVHRPAIIARNYQIVHYDSPDERGVDVAFLYRPDCFQLTKSWVRHETSLPNNDKTRDMLAIEGFLDGEHVYFLVDHWPSRSGGQKRSEPLRDTVAKHDRQVIDSILAIDPNAKIMFMGDLNDDPTDASVIKYMKATGKLDKLKPEDLYNPYNEKYKSGNGTLAYNDAWNLFDQIFISQAYLKENTGLKFVNSFIFKKKYMFQQDGRFEGYPLRTFVGDEFMGGFSDHFPVYTIISKTK